MSWAWENRDLIGALSVQQVALAAPSILLSLLLAVPLARLVHRHRAAREAILGVSGVVYAVPSLAVFVILPGLLRTRILDPLNVVVALTLYGIALMVRTACEAFDAIDPDVIRAARAQGHSPWQLFARVELPEAGQAILAGLRVVSASTLSLVSVGALIGVQSLGSLFTEGYERSFLAEIGTGILATVVLAVLFDLALVLLGSRMMPWTRKRRQAERRTAL